METTIKRRLKKNRISNQNSKHGDVKNMKEKNYSSIYNRTLVNKSLRVCIENCLECPYCDKSESTITFCKLGLNPIESYLGEGITENGDTE